MPEYLAILLAFAAAVVPAAAVCRLMMLAPVLDAPIEERKLMVQSRPVPTLGGVGIATGTAIGVLAVALIADWSLTGTIVITFGAALASLALGFADDAMHLPALGRFLCMLAIALTMTVLGVRVGDSEPWPGLLIDLPVFVAVGGSMLWLIVVINAVNFMDGANGLAMGMAAIAAAGLAIAAAFVGAWNIALLAGALSGALVGFLVWNIPGRLFAGDTGALFAGTVLGGLCLELVRVRPDLLFVPPILLMPFLSDVLLTLIWRMQHGKKLWESHLDHVYQIALKARLKHWQVSAIHAVWAMNAALIGIVAAIVGREVPLLAFVVLLLVSTWVHLWARKVGVKAGLVGAKVA